MSSLNHSFDIHVAKKFTIEEAVLIRHFQFWISRNKNLKRNIHEGRTWTYETIEEIAAHFPYWTEKQVERILNKLFKNKIIIKGNYNKNGYDRTVWYAFNDESFFIESPIDISRNREMDIPKSGNGYPEIGTPIPDTKTDTKTNKESKPKKTERSSLASKDAHDPIQFSNEVQEISEMLNTSILSLRPNFKFTQQALEAGKLEIDRMIRIDSRDPEEIMKVLQWLPNHSFWQKNILSGHKLRIRFDQLCIDYELSKDDKTKYKNFAYKVKKCQRINSLRISDKGIYDPSSQNFELSFVMPYEDFCRSLTRKYNVKDYQGDME